MRYERCSCNNLPDLYRAFRSGFADYTVKLDVPYQVFAERFFQPAWNQLEHSFIAYDGSLPVGMILGGIRHYEGIRTMRCGGLCVIPEYRRRQVGHALYQLHRREAVENRCKQLFLEVIAGNEPAIAFYKRLGYQKVYDLRYYVHNRPEELGAGEEWGIEIRPFSAGQVRAAANPETHINWQNTLEYIENDDVQFYGVAGEAAPLAYLCISRRGKLFQLWVNPDHRHQGIASALLSHAITRLGLNKVSASTPNNASLEGFLRKREFVEERISQHEMYLTLS